jgi:hypothetical protein
MDFASPHTEEAYSALWLSACFANMRAEKTRAGWGETASAWRAIERYAAALGNAQDERVFRGLAEEAEVKAVVEDEMNKGAAGPSDGT